MSASELKVQVKRDKFLLKSRNIARTLDSPTLMLQLSQSLCQNSETNRFKSISKKKLIDNEESKNYEPIQEQEEDG